MLKITKIIKYVLVKCRPQAFDSGSNNAKINKVLN